MTKNGRDAPPTQWERAPSGASQRATSSTSRPKGRQRQLPQRRTLELEASTITYLLKVSSRARQLRLSVRPDTGLEVTTPTGVPVTRIEAVLREKAAWIEATLQRFTTQTPAATLALHDDATLPFAGMSLQLRFRQVPTATRIHVGLVGTTLTVTTPRTDYTTVRPALEAWYRRQAHTVIAGRVAHWNARYGFEYGRISIKDQKSRWGSCSHSGNLNFNWRLLLAPLDVLEYIVIHELAHLREGNHSPRFWALVATLCPNFKQHRRWLRLHGHELRF
jgi:predicted metal-dependent hydrolase